MGGFLLIKREKDLDVEEVERRYSDSISVFYKKGLSLNRRVVTSEFVIYVFNKYQFKADKVVWLDGDQFIISTGTHIYNRKTGTDALEQLHKDFSLERQEFLSHLLGNYCLVISKGGKLCLLNSYSGLYRVYCDKSRSVISSSFLAVFKSLRERNISIREFYEYVFDGAFHGDKTVIGEIDLIDTRSILQLSPLVATIPKSLNFNRLDRNSQFDEMVWEVSRSLIDYFNIIKENFGNSVCAGLTAGSDTRLMLALMRKVGIEPYLYVYGDEDSPNVKIAKTIAKGEGLNLDHEDRSKLPRIKKDEFPSFLEKQHYIIDGLGNEGIFDDGSDLSTRFKRIEKAQLQLNGAGDLADIYYSLPDKTFSIESIVKAKYDRGDYSMCCPDYFDKAAYFSTFSEKIKCILDVSENRIDRQHIERL
jgi:hypothetical protein